MVLPRALMRWISSQKLRRAWWIEAGGGSSRKISSGSLTRAMANSSRWRWPPDSLRYRGGEIRPARRLRSIRRTAGSGYRTAEHPQVFAAGDEILQRRGLEHDADFLAKARPRASPRYRMSPAVGC